MALNDLTPQLRTRLSRMERAVGWFVLLATALLIFGFAYYLVVMAERKGWFIKKIRYQTFVQSGAGLKVGDPVKLMGFDVGQITAVVPNEPYEYYNITVYFEIKHPHYGYLWSDSKAKVVSDFLNNRYLEVTKGRTGMETIYETNKAPIGYWNYKYVETVEKELTKQIAAAVAATNGNYSAEDIDDEVSQERNSLKQQYPWKFYLPLTNDAVCTLYPAESPALTERLEAVVSAVEKALPNFLALTNALARALSNLGDVTAHADELLVTLKPTATNLAVITGNIRDPHGSLGEWIIPTNLNRELTATLTSAHEGIDALSSNLTVTLENLSGITSNLNAQVQANSNILSGISKTVVDADDFVQGLKRHWLLRSAFKSKGTNQPSSSAEPAQRLNSPKEK